MRSSIVGPSSFVGDDFPPEVRRAPDPRPQALELDDLAVVYEQMDLGSVILYVPCKHVRVGRLEHDALKAEGIDDPRRHVGAPPFHVLGDPLGFDHDQLGPGIEEPTRKRDRPRAISPPLLLVLLAPPRAARRRP